VKGFLPLGVAADYLGWSARTGGLVIRCLVANYGLRLYRHGRGRVHIDELRACVADKQINVRKDRSPAVVIVDGVEHVV